MKTGRTSKLTTTVGTVDSQVLAFTVGRDPEIDILLAEADCIGTAAHVTMLSRLRLRRPILTLRDRRRVVAALAKLIDEIRRGAFRIRLADQDVHMAVESVLTARLGALGGRIHTGRSRNDQVALDLRLYARSELLHAIEETAAAARAAFRLAARHRNTPMVGRTHCQPAMPSSVALWASAHGESLLDDLSLLQDAYRLNDKSPLGAAAGYGVPLPLDRAMTARLLGFRGVCHNVLYAVNARGKLEAAILSAMGQTMLSLSRLASDLIIFSMPEFGYFRLPPEYCTGSSIMPQKQNPDVCELVRAKAAAVLSGAAAVAEIVRGLPSGYQRDLQETKAPFVEGIAATRSSLRIMTMLIEGIVVDRGALARGFTPGVFAADRALELVASGMPFRDAYKQVKRDLSALAAGKADARAAIARRTHVGGPAGLDLAMLGRHAAAAAAFARGERRRYCAAISKLLGARYAD